MRRHCDFRFCNYRMFKDWASAMTMKHPIVYSRIYFRLSKFFTTLILIPDQPEKSDNENKKSCFFSERFQREVINTWQFDERLRLIIEYLSSHLSNLLNTQILCRLKLSNLLGDFRNLKLLIAAPI
jgi:hypothetical protein